MLTVPAVEDGLAQKLTEDVFVNGLEFGETLDEQGNRRVLVRSSALESGMPIVTTHLPNAMTGLKVDTGEAAAEPAQ